MLEIPSVFEGVLNREVIAVVAEFDPLHNGHFHLINSIKKYFNPRAIVVILSGPFLQRGNISLFSPFDRAKMAIYANCDMVFEMPCYYSLDSADKFADCAMQVISSLGFIDRVVFGSEDGNIKALEKIAKLLLYEKNNCKKFNFIDKTILEKLGSQFLDIYKKPNNILGICYIMSILKNKYNILYSTITRNSDYNSRNINDNIYPSATSIRNNLLIGNISKAISSCPVEIASLIKNLIINKEIVDFDKYNNYVLSLLSNINLSNIKGMTNDLDNLIYKNIKLVNSLEELIIKIKTKNYTYTHLNRVLSYCILQISNTGITLNRFEEIRLLAFNSNETTKSLLRNSEAKIYTNPKHIIRTNDFDNITQKAYYVWDLCSGVKKSTYFQNKCFNIRRM